MRRVLRTRALRAIPSTTCSWFPTSGASVPFPRPVLRRSSSRTGSQFDALVDSAEQLSQAIKTTTAELEALNVENDRLRAELLQLQAEHSACEPPQAQAPVRHIPFPFVHRPPGGFGDEEVEEELVEAVDEADDQSTIRKTQSEGG